VAGIQRALCYKQAGARLFRNIGCADAGGGEGIPAAPNADADEHDEHADDQYPFALHAASLHVTFFVSGTIFRPD
jgi:hypothetical protein